MLKRIAAFVLTALIAAAMLGACSHRGETALETQPKLFKSESEVKSVVDRFFNNTYSNYRNSNTDMGAAVPESDQSGSADYSKTNTQTEGIDEGDTVKTDGKYIYKLQTNGLVIVSADSGKLEKVSEIKIDNYVPQELYILNNKLVLIGGVYTTLNYYGSRSIEPMDCCMCFSYNDTDIRIYDITDRFNPVLERQLTVNGSYFTSRLIENKFYYITNYYFYRGDENNYIPKISDSLIDGGSQKKIPLENIFYYESVPSYSYMIIGEIDIDNPQSGMLKAYLGLGGEIYVSENFIYTASADYSSCYTKNLFGWDIAQNSYAKTRIIKFALSDLSQKAITRVDGTIKDRYSLDEYEGNLRVATTVNIWGGVSVRSDTAVSDNSVVRTSVPQVNRNIYSNVYVLNAELDLIGKSEGIAYGETIYSVRFNKEGGSLVTFRMTDPYFKLDLSDPHNPKVSQGLVEDGVSQYIHYIGNSGFTIGVGRDTEVINTQWGERTVWKGLKVSLYDTNGAEAVNLATPVLDGDYVFAEIFYNPRALLYKEDKGLFAFPVQIWDYSRSYNYWQPEHMKQGVAVYSFDTANKQLSYRGMLTNFDENVNLGSWPDYYNNYWKFITRCLYIDNYLYTISERFITPYKFDTLEKAEPLEVVNSSEIVKVY